MEYQNNKTIEKNSKQTILNFEKDNFKFNDEDNNNHCFKFNEEDNTSHNKDMQITDNIKNEICNKQNQWYTIYIVKNLHLLLKLIYLLMKRIL